MGGKSKTSLTLDKELWKKFKIKCVQEEKSNTEVIEELIDQWEKGKIRLEKSNDKTQLNRYKAHGISV